MKTNTAYTADIPMPRGTPNIIWDDYPDEIIDWLSYAVHRGDVGEFDLEVARKAATIWMIAAAERSARH